MTAPKARKDAPKGTAAEERPLKVLVVDDYGDNRELFAEYLTFHGFTVLEAANGNEAIASASANVPDIILMDLSLPGIDGWEATRRLKGAPGTQHIPVIAVTGHAMQGHSEKAREAGCDGFIAKPCLPATLLEEIRATLERTRGGARKKGASR